MLRHLPKHLEQIYQQKLYQLLHMHKVTLHWVKGHDGHAYNERCDALATAFADSQKD